RVVAGKDLLLQRGAGEGAEEFRAGDLAGKMRADHPPDAKADGDGFRDGAAGDDESGAVEGLQGPWTLHAAIQVAVDVVLDDRNAGTGQRLDQCLLRIIRSEAPRRV